MRSRILAPDLTRVSLSFGRKLCGEVRVAFLSDLHGESYGASQSGLFLPIRSFAPDLVIFGGDTFDERVAWGTATETLRLSAARWPTFYTPGNHEIKTGRADEIKRTAAFAGATVLAGKCVRFQVRGSTLLLCGVEDPLRQEALHRAQLRAAQAEIDPDCCSVLITHRPEREESYCSARPGFDLLLTGHAHGGQWRFPPLKNGFFAPDQGLFPTFSGGLRLTTTGYHLCSRGLARHNTRVPRIGNRPELILLTLCPGNAPPSCITFSP